MSGLSVLYLWVGRSSSSHKKVPTYQPESADCTSLAGVSFFMKCLSIRKYIRLESAMKYPQDGIKLEVINVSKAFSVSSLRLLSIEFIEEMK